MSNEELEARMRALENAVSWFRGVVTVAGAVAVTLVFLVGALIDARVDRNRGDIQEVKDANIRQETRLNKLSELSAKQTVLQENVDKNLNELKSDIKFLINSLPRP